MCDMMMFVFHKTLVKNSRSKKYTELFSAFPSHFVFTLLSNQTNSKEDFSGDEWLGFTFLGVMEAR